MGFSKAIAYSTSVKLTHNYCLKKLKIICVCQPLIISCSGRSTMSSFHTIIALLGCPLLNLAADVCALVAQLLTNLSLLLQYLIIRSSPRRGNYASLEWSNLCTRLGKEGCMLSGRLYCTSRAECSVETHSRTQRKRRKIRQRSLGVHLRACADHQE
jgi:hypothetical protein